VPLLRLFADYFVPVELEMTYTVPRNSFPSGADILVCQTFTGRQECLPHPEVAFWDAYHTPQGFNSQLLSFFRAVPKLPRWYTDAPAGENVNASNFSSSNFFR